MTNTTPEKKDNKHPCRVEKAARLEIIADMLIQHFPRRSIIRFCSEQWGIGERAAEKYMKQASDRIIEAADINLGKELKYIVAGLKKIINEGFRNKKQIHLALSAIKELSELLKLKTIQIEVNETVTFKSQIGDDGSIHSSWYDENGEPIDQGKIAN